MCAKRVCNKGRSMSSADVADCQFWAGRLIEKERRSAGGKLPAVMDNVSRRSGVRYGTLWSLRYRPPTNIITEVYFRLKALYEAELESQEAKLRHELMLARAAGLDEANSDSYREAAALLCEKESNA